MKESILSLTVRLRDRTRNSCCFAPAWNRGDRTRMNEERSLMSCEKQMTPDKCNVFIVLGLNWQWISDTVRLLELK